VTVAHPRLRHVQIIPNVYITDDPHCLGECSSLREASLRLEISHEDCWQNGELLAQLPASLESLIVNLVEGDFPVRSSPLSAVHTTWLLAVSGFWVYLGTTTAASCQ